MVLRSFLGLKPSSLSLGMVTNLTSRPQICVGDMCVSHLQAKGQQHHLSQNIGLAIAGVAKNLIIRKYYHGVDIS